jgi:hypothetical protein
LFPNFADVAMPPVTREDRAKADKYAKAVAQINSKAKELRDLQNSLPNLLDSVSQIAQERLVHTAPKHWHAEAALSAIDRDIDTSHFLLQGLGMPTFPVISDVPPVACSRLHSPFDACFQGAIFDPAGAGVCPADPDKLE